MIHYARSSLARELAEQLQGKQVFNDAYNGLFLAAPRRMLTAVDSRTNPASTAGTAQHDLDLVSG